MFNWNQSNQPRDINIVPADRAIQIIASEIRLASMGFSDIKRGFYGRQIDTDIIHLIKIQAIKGASYTIWWGISLRFMPHKWDTSLQWHRSFRASRFDLFEQPWEYLINSQSSPQEQEQFSPTTMYGEILLQKAVAHMWSILHPELVSWFESTSTLPGVLERSNQQVYRSMGPQHHPAPLLISAFTLARLGRKEDAQQSLSQYFSRFQETEKARGNLIRALELAISQ